MHVCLKDVEGLKIGDLVEIFPLESNKTLVLV